MSEPLYGIHRLTNEELRRAAMVSKLALEIMNLNEQQFDMELDGDKKRFNCSPNVHTYLGLAIDLILKADSAIDSQSYRERDWLKKSA